MSSWERVDSYFNAVMRSMIDAIRPEGVFVPPEDPVVLSWLARCNASGWINLPVTVTWMPNIRASAFRISRTS